MHIKEIKLKNFRNYADLSMNFSEGINVIYGDNAQGKTNILEAFFLCASGRSHRTSKDIDLIKLNENVYKIEIDYFKDKLDRNIQISFDREGKKKIRINEIAARKIGDLIGNMNAIMFSPEDLMIIKEGPQERRRFIDITLSQIKPTYFYDLQQYTKILLQRNKLLKEIQNNRKMKEMLEIWNEQMIKEGSKIMKIREGFIERINEKAKKEHLKLTDNKEDLLLKYTPSFKINNNLDRSEIENEFRRVLKYSETREIAKGSSLYGPQRDDYEIFLNGVNIKTYGSQGQQRTAILSVKLAEIDIMKEETEEIPVLLLDDVMSELDMKRQHYLYDNLKNIQTFITCTEKNVLGESDERGIKYYKVQKGAIIEE